MIAPSFIPDGQPQHEPSKIENLKDGILTLVSMHKESYGLHEAECQAGMVMALKGLAAHLEQEEIASWDIAPRAGQWDDLEMSA
jgi:hypothetical protein